MTNEEITAGLRICDAATKDPRVTERAYAVSLRLHEIWGTDTRPQCIADEDFITYARTALPEALKELREARAEIERLTHSLRTVDDVLVVNWVTPPGSRGDYREALNRLVEWNIQIHDDPAVSEVAAKRKEEIERLREDKAKLRATLDEIAHDSKYSGEAGLARQVLEEIDAAQKSGGK